MVAHPLKIPAILERGEFDVASVFDAFGVGIYCTDLGGRFTYVNPAGQALLGWSAEELIGRDAQATIHHPDHQRPPPLQRTLTRGASTSELGDVFWRSDGSPLEVEQTIAPLREAGRQVGTIVVFLDVSQRRREAELVRRRAGQQSALAALGLLALGGGSLQPLLEQAAEVVAHTLEVEVAQAFELDLDGGCLRLRAGVGFRDGLVGTATVETGRGSLAGYTVARDEPVVVEDLRTEGRFRAPRLLLEHGVVSGLTVVIHGRGSGAEPWGVLGAHARTRRAFTEEDVGFLHTVANTLGLAIERSAAEQQLRQRNREIAELAEQVSRLADDRRRIMADALDAEDRTREQISQILHDEVLQSLLAARQDLAKLKPAGRDPGDAVTSASEAIVGAIRELRNAVVALHPVTLEQGGVVSALKAIADLHARRGGFEVTLNVRPQAIGLRDQLIVSLAQELLSNVAQHAGASHVSLALQRTVGGVVFEVTDDGRGMSAVRPRQALDDGHVGLASAAMRVESLGGSFELTSSPGAGTRVRSVIPVEPPMRGPGRRPAFGGRATE